jgi:glycine/D-amino acid oxidase-like deaminating enzyme
MNLLSPSPFWPIRDGLPASYPALDDNASCDVAILGAGINGALAALHLAEAGVDVVVLDRRDVAHGGTAESTSLLRARIQLFAASALNFGVRYSAQLSSEARRR